MKRKVMLGLALALLLTGVAVAQISAPPYVAKYDVNDDGRIDSLDIQLVSAHWGAVRPSETPTLTQPPPPATATRTPTLTQPPPPAATVTRTPTLTQPPPPAATVTRTPTRTATTQPATATATRTPTRTATIQPPTATVTRTPTPTATHNNQTGVCGESMELWHAPVVNGCETGHEHGDPPPQWITNAGYQVRFQGHFNTSPTEHTYKHAAMKTFLARFNNVDVYFRVHAASNVLDRGARFHSYEVWARDPSGAVSHWQGWYDVGDPTTKRPSKLFCQQQQGDPLCNRPVIIVVDQASWDADQKCEQWYAQPVSPWHWYFGWTVCDSTTYFYPGETSQLDMSYWRLTGGVGGGRRLEVTWTREDDGTLPGEAPEGVVFYATQFGEIVSGPNDAICSGSTTINGVTYRNVCLAQFIARTMPKIDFLSPGGNAIHREFDTTGVRIPN